VETDQEGSLRAEGATEVSPAVHGWVEVAPESRKCRRHDRGEARKSRFLFGLKALLGKTKIKVSRTVAKR
jgi:hypothetical protein